MYSFIYKRKEGAEFACYTHCKHAYILSTENYLIDKKLSGSRIECILHPHLMYQATSELHNLNEMGKIKSAITIGN